MLVMLIKAVVLKSIESDRGLQDVLEIDKTEQILSPTHC